MLIRLQKYLADRGTASRRKCEDYIRQGLIKVNGTVVTAMGTKVDPEKDQIIVSPKLTAAKQKLRYIMLHKPAGYVCSVTGPECPKVLELLAGVQERLFPVGRLDKLTSGLLLLTNDGRFSYEMTHPKFRKEKEYVIKVREKISLEHLRVLRAPLVIHGKKCLPAEIFLDAPHRFRAVLREGRNRQIRRLCQKAGLTIEKLKRIRIEKLLLGSLPAGHFRALTMAELTLLRRS